jgi:hypothetical protein
MWHLLALTVMTFGEQLTLTLNDIAFDGERVLLAQSGQKGFDRIASGLAHDVADEEEFHAGKLTTKDTKETWMVAAEARRHTL